MWNRQETIKPVEKIKAQTIVTNGSYNNLNIEELVKQDLTRSIVEGLMKDYITLRKQKSPFTQDTEYQAELSVIKPNFTDLTNIVVDDYVYKVKNIEFTHQQIEEAVTKQFPEYFL